VTGNQPSPGVRVGDRLPDFEGTTAGGGRICRDDLTGRPAVLFFYPKAGTVGCSIESREFARRHDEFVASGIRVVGISVDSTDDQQRFREECHLPFDLVADEDRTISRRFGVLGAAGVARRRTFVVDGRGRVVGVVRSWRPKRHVEGALSALLKAPDTAAGTSEAAVPGTR